jgi:hypothetical protein
VGAEELGAEHAGKRMTYDSHVVRRDGYVVTCLPFGSWMWMCRFVVACDGETPFLRFARRMRSSVLDKIKHFTYI